MTELTFEDLINGISTAPSMPTLTARTTAIGHAPLPQTIAVLQAARLTAEAEMRARGLDATSHGNPLDPILAPDHETLFYLKLRSAIELASAASAFDSPDPTRPWAAGQRVRLHTRPNAEIGLPRSIISGALGTLIRPYDTTNSGPGWYVDFDGDTQWWTTTDSLELL